MSVSLQGEKMNGLLDLTNFLTTIKEQKDFLTFVL
jgi:hypothetical protein